MLVRVNRPQAPLWSYLRKTLASPRPKGHTPLGNEPQFAANAKSQLHPLVPPQVSHLRQVPLRTSVKFPHSRQLSPS